jgi:hypothetical protein
LEVKSDEGELLQVFMTAGHQSFTISLQNIILILDLVTNWHVSDETSLLDLRYILLQLGDLEIFTVSYHNPKRINWESHWEGLKVNLGVAPRVVQSVQDVELADDLVQQAIFFSYHQNCQAMVALSPRRVPW